MDLERSPINCMTFYFYLYLLPSIFALGFATPRYLPSRSIADKLSWLLPALGLTLVIGLRHEVGGDWGNYLPLVERAHSLDVSDVFLIGDPAYMLLNWLGANLGGGIYLVNTVCGFFFSLGLVKFCRLLPRPWLALAAAVPYLILVVAMGYSRQGVALGIAMWGLAAIQQGYVWRFILLIALAGMFHKSAVVLILIALFSPLKNRVLTILAVLGVGVGLYMFLLFEAVEALKVGYLDDEYQSSGAGVRVAMNALPGLLFLLLNRRLVLSVEQRQFWTKIAWISLGFIGLLFVSPSSTAVDRVALYLIPLQLFVWSHFPDAVGRAGGRNFVGVLIVLGYYAAVLLVWLFFADHRTGWIPYKFLPLELL